MTDETVPPRSFRRRGLGRGLEALLSSESEAAAEGPALVNVDPRSVAPNPEQPRRAFDADSLQALGDSIRLHGLLHPIVVQRDGDTYRLVAGERRLRAAQLAGVSAIPAIVRPAAVSGRQSLEVALTENLVRSDLNPMEEAAAYARLSDAFGLTHEAIALRLGRTRSGVSNAIRLLNLPAPVQEAVAESRLTAGHARALLVLTNASDQEAVAAVVIADGLSVRETEQAVRARLERDSAPARPRTSTSEPVRLTPDDAALRRGLEQALGVSVRLQRRKGGGGRIVIDWAEDADLDALYERLGGPPL
ncbi:MAG TPA: ParB/RepB/Spo0J family partition protein [Candidatus Saccharimonadales bacterium]|nr:ParB/RepB/Spo0J family partition protein [Candidatus Saccharimonadales bacterium]